MSETAGRRAPIDVVAEDFLARFRRGEAPSPSDYAARYPELAAEIHELFPVLVLMEAAGPTPAHAAPARRDAGVAAVPDRLGNYRILREVGRGGMGVVYEAVQVSLNRRVALKVLPAGASNDPLGLARFHREARSAARMHHGNIVP